MLKLKNSWLLIKNLFAQNKTLFICIEFCICLCFIFALYAANFITKLCIFNGDNTSRVEINDSYRNARNKISDFPLEKAASFVVYIDGVAVVHLIDTDFPITQGRKPVTENEILSSRTEDSGKIGQEIIIDGNTYTLVGWSRFIEDDFLLCASSLSNDTVIRDIVIASNFELSPNEFSRLVGRCFSDYPVINPPKPSFDDLFKGADVILPVILVLLLTIAALSLILQYLLNKLYSSVGVLVLSGYKNVQIFSILTAAALALLTLPLILGEIIYLPIEFFALNAVLSPSLGVKYSLGFFNHVEIIVLYVIMLILFIIPKLKKLSSGKLKVGYDA